MKRFFLVLILIISLFPNLTFAEEEMSYKTTVQETVIKDTGNPISGFTFDELIRLSREYKPQGELKEKLEAHLNMVFVVNRINNSDFQRPFLRIAHWNAERGFHLKDIKNIFTAPHVYEAEHIKNVKKRHLKHFKDELQTLSSSDVLCLNELDVGLPRTNYRNNPIELADSLGWNYAYVTEFVEVGPLYSKEKVDPEKYKGLHGGLVASRFPIKETMLIELPQCYDWYKDEAKKHLSPVEHLRRFGASKIFREHLTRKEVRHGRRYALAVDLELPNENIVTVVHTHFEDRAYPDCRLKQFNSLLSSLKNYSTPVVLTGDFNTSTTDTKPTSVNKEVFKRVRDPDFIMRTTGSFFVPGLPIATGLAAIAVSKLLQYKDPFFPHIPVVFPNHERKFYAAVKDFKFADGETFDLNGDKEKSSNGRRGLLANSNQRHWKGFKSTYKLEEPRIIAYFKLDWFFIKPKGEFFKPFNGRTLKTVNNAVEGAVSDHNPITVDIELLPGAGEKYLKVKREKEEEGKKKAKKIASVSEEI